MGRGNESFGKKEVRAKKEKKRKEKAQKKEDRKRQSRDGNNLNDMIAYVDEFGNITSTPPDISQKKDVKVEDIVIGVPRRAESDEDIAGHRGVVTFFDESRGFGFIKESNTRQDIFVHVNSLTEPVKENTKVTFDIIKGVKGPNAINVKIDRE